MSCCVPAIGVIDLSQRKAQEELLLASRDIGNGLRQTDLSIPDIHCGACIQRIERAIGAMPGVTRARVNLSTKRTTIDWRKEEPPPLIEALRSLGYEAHLCDEPIDDKDAVLTELIRALAVAGFAASNIMLLSVSIWSGADAATRDLFHWLSAAIALPTLLYSGRVFYVSAWHSIRHGRTNMDVPISIGVLLAFGLSLYETIHAGQHAYFDAAVSLLFFLLIGRTLDHMMRDRARVAVKGLARLAARSALVQRPHGGQEYLPVESIELGMTILLAAGERVPVNACVTGGASELDCSLISGESTPQPVKAGDQLLAGMLNLTGPLTIAATSTAKDSFLAEMLRMMEAAESGRSAHRRIADRAAQLYAPVVHLTALLTFGGWMLATGDVHLSMTIAIAVLIITCPCALGLAVPMVHVAAARRLFEQGVMVKGGAALERLAEIDQVIFDKTGTLTLDQSLLSESDFNTDDFAVAAAMASHSRHPYSRAICAKSEYNTPAVQLDHVSEYPGLGLEAQVGRAIFRLGRCDWALAELRPDQSMPQAASVVLSKDGQYLAAFIFEQRLRLDAHQAIEALFCAGLPVSILSGDQAAPVQAVAAKLEVPYLSGVSPGEKTSFVAEIVKRGYKPLMVGDGLNDAPALTAAHASIAPASAVDVGRNAADFVFLRESLKAIPEAIAVSRQAARLVKQNLWLAGGYNLIAVPIAVLGYVTPLIAAIAMSLSSVIVVANALRLSRIARSPSKDVVKGARGRPNLRPIVE